MFLKSLPTTLQRMMGVRAIAVLQWIPVTEEGMCRDAHACLFPCSRNCYVSPMAAGPHGESSSLGSGSSSNCDAGDSQEALGQTSVQGRACPNVSCMSPSVASMSCMVTAGGCALVLFWLHLSLVEHNTEAARMQFGVSARLPFPC